MTLSLTVRLRDGRYDAGGSRPGEAEWPPHPARVFCALAASAQDPGDWDALRWLESAGLPQVLAEASAVTTSSRTFVVTNRTEQTGGSQFWPGRTNQMRSRSSAVPGTDRFAIVWPEAVPAPGILARLEQMARRVPYVGRVTSQAEVSVVAAVPDPDQAWETWVPASIGSPGAVDLRVPYGGYTERLGEAFADGARAWEVARSAPYTAASTTASEAAASEEVHSTAWDDLVIWGFERGTARINGDQVVHIASMLRRAVLSVLGSTQVPVPSQVSGHGADDLPHAAFLGLPDAGHRHADGHLLGVALAVPGNLPADQWRHLMRTVISPAFDSFTPWRARSIGLEYRPKRQQGLHPEHWTGSADGERSWVTVTPIATDGMPRKGRTYEELVCRSFRNRGYPELTDVEVSPAPLTSGAVWRPRAGTLPPGRDRWPLVHAKVTFERPVRGPVLAGALRGLGLGLMLPSRSRDE
jgi:CRISPR-associated protein Csb2